MKADDNSDRKVNLALETVFKFEEPGLRTNFGFIDKMQDFLARIKGAMKEPDEDEKFSRRRNQDTRNDKHLVDYLEQAITILLTYDDEDIKSLTRALNEEVRKYNYKGSKFHELANDKVLSKVMRRLLNDLEVAPASMIRLKLNKALDGLRNTNEQDKELIDFVDSLYSPDSKDRLSKVINNLEHHKVRMRADDNDGGEALQEMIGGAVKDLVFDHYTSLNNNTRRMLKVRINAYFGDLFQHAALKQNIVRSQPKRGLAHLIGLDEINEMFKFSTVVEKEKTILRREQTKARVTKGLMESRTSFKDKFYEPSSQEPGLKEGSSTETSSDSLNEESEAPTKATKATTQKRFKTKKKAKTTKPVKPKRFRTKKNSESMRTIWEEIQTMPPQAHNVGRQQPQALQRRPKKERIIVEEHNAVINIGSFRNALKFNKRAGDAKFTGDTNKDSYNDKSTDGSDEGLTLEFDGKTNLDKKSTSHRGRNRNKSFNLRRGGERASGDFSDDSQSSSAKEIKRTVKEDKNPVPKNPSNENDDSNDSLPDDSKVRVTAALVNDEGDGSNWDSRKVMAKQIQGTNNENSVEAFTKKLLTEMKTTSLSEEDVNVRPNAKGKKEQLEGDVEDSKQHRTADDSGEVQRRDNDKDNLKGSKPATGDKTIETNITASKYKDKNGLVDDYDSKVTKTIKEGDESDSLAKITLTSSTSDPDATKPSSKTESKENTSASLKTSKTIGKDEADVINPTGDVAKTTEVELPEERNQIKSGAKENATEELRKSKDEKPTDVAKELAAKTRSRASSENEVQDNQLDMSWDTKDVL